MNGGRKMPVDIEHTRMRFRTMNIRQLWVRLERISLDEKLRHFVTVATEYWQSTRNPEYRRMAEEASFRLGRESPPIALSRTRRPGNFISRTTLSSGARIERANGDVIDGPNALQEYRQRQMREEGDWVDAPAPPVKVWDPKAVRKIEISEKESVRKIHFGKEK
jgi:hypothetical protein